MDITTINILHKYYIPQSNLYTCSLPTTDSLLTTPYSPKWSPLEHSSLLVILSLKKVYFCFIKVIDKKENIDWKRNTNLFLVGAGYFAPMLHNWYCRALPYFGSLVFKETTPKAARVLISMAADQLAFAPIVLAGFFIVNALIDDTSM